MLHLAQQDCPLPDQVVLRALRLWLLGQLLVMVSIGVLTWIALFFIGIPSALALAFIAGVLEFNQVAPP